MPGGTEAPLAAQPVDGPRSLMNPPPPSPPPPWSKEQWSKEQWPKEQWPQEQWPQEQWPQEQWPQEQAPQEQASGDPGPADRVWWRAAHSPGSGWDDTSEEWLRSLRGPAIQQPPPHSAE